MCRFLVTASVVPSSPILVTLMKEALSSSETSVLTRATWRNFPGGNIVPNSPCCNCCGNSGCFRNPSDRFHYHKVSSLSIWSNNLIKPVYLSSHTNTLQWTAQSYRHSHISSFILTHGYGKNCFFLTLSWSSQPAPHYESIILNASSYRTTKTWN
jgi:hypothetical protein